jgi:hypothetical protein
MSSARGKRIEDYCKIIWGSHCDYDIDIETDDWENYSCIVKRDFGLSFGPPLTITSLCYGSEAAWAELERMLGLWAEQVLSGKPVTKDESLEIFGGSRGEHKKLLSKFLDVVEKKEGTKSG